MHWLCPTVWTAEQIVEAVMVETHTLIRPFKPKNWVLCHQLSPLKEAIVLMVAYTLAKAGLYLIPNAWKAKGEKARQRSSMGKRRRDKWRSWETGPKLQPGGEVPNLPPMMKPQGRNSISWCFTYGQPRHFQQECLHMDCSLIKLLWGT